MMLPFVFSLPDMKAFWPLSWRGIVSESCYDKNTGGLTLPVASSTKVSSERIRVTSALGFAGPLVTVPVFFRSIVQMATSPSLFLICSSKIPFVYGINYKHEMKEDGSEPVFRTFLISAAFSWSLNAETAVPRFWMRSEDCARTSATRYARNKKN